MIFNAILSQIGLDENDCANFLGVKQKAIIRWNRGGHVPQGIYSKICLIVEKQNDYADLLLMEWKAAGYPNPYKVTCCKDDEEAVTLGWPTRKVQIHAIALTQTLLPQTKILIS